MIERLTAERETIIEHDARHWEESHPEGHQAVFELLAEIDALRQERDALAIASRPGRNYCDNGHPANWHDDEYCPVCEYRRVIADLRADVERHAKILAKAIDDFLEADQNRRWEGEALPMQIFYQALREIRGEVNRKDVERPRVELEQQKHCPVCEYRRVIADLRADLKTTTKRYAKEVECNQALLAEIDRLRTELEPKRHCPVCDYKLTGKGVADDKGE